MYAIVNSLDCYLTGEYDSGSGEPQWGEFGDAMHFKTASDALQAAFELGITYEQRFSNAAPYTLDLVRLEKEYQFVVGEVM